MTVESTLEEQVADRELLAVDGHRGGAGDRDRRDVIGDRLHLHVVQRHLEVDAADLGEVGLVAQHVESLQLLDEADQGILERAPLARQHDVDRTEDVLVVHGVEELAHGGLGRVGAAVRAAGHRVHGEATGHGEGGDADDRRRAHGLCVASAPLPAGRRRSRRAR